MHLIKKVIVMQHKSYKSQGNTSANVVEPAVGYGRIGSQKSPSNSWNPNVPFIGTQEEWWEHFHQIEQGEFMTIEEADKEFEIWEKKLLASRM